MKIKGLLKLLNKPMLVTAAMAIALASCGPEPTTPSGETDTAKERLIIYSVGQTEVRQPLHTEAQWDAMLELICDQALEGKTVTFYNMCQTTYTSGSGGTKAAVSFSTTSRDEMMAWMKEMEKQGRTVNVSYDRSTGRWNGMAYACSPTQLSANNVIGVWHLTQMNIVQNGDDGVIDDPDIYLPGENYGTMTYTFLDNGTATLFVQDMNGETFTQEAPWNISNDGEMTCELLPSNSQWNINWISSSTMIISTTNQNPDEGYLLFQMQFEKE